MKRILLLSAFLSLVTYTGKAQNQSSTNKFDNLFVVYSEILSPYLKELANADYNTYNSKYFPKGTMVFSRYSLYLSKSKYIGNNVKKSFAVSTGIENRVLVYELNQKHKEIIPNLPEEFFTKVLEKIEKK